MLLGFPNPVVPHERAEKQLVSACVEGSELDPSLEISDALVVGGGRDETFQHGRVAAAKSAPLRGEPGRERRAAV